MRKKRRNFDKITKKAMELAEEVDHNRMGLTKAKMLLRAYRMAHDSQVAAVRYTPKKKI